MKPTTIAAISTPFGRGGIGIIRLSGDRAVQILQSLFRKSGTRAEKAVGRNDGMDSHRLYHGHIVDPHTRQRIDEVLAVAMLGPRSYTRENVVEIHSHSGPVVLGKLFELVLQAGAMAAEPGEFTKRAFLNGRIDLTQAEAVIDIIQAKSEAALQIANRQLAGGVTQKIEPIRKALQSILVELEAAIDFPEDVEERFDDRSMLAELKNRVIAPIERMLASYRANHYYREGVKMVIVGRPNVGKSSLMNRLIDRDRAIVTAVPGTTRDVIEEMFYIHGLPVVITDTAGLHAAAGEVEKIGMQRTRESIRDADIVLFMVDASMEISREDQKVYAQVRNKKKLIVGNKIDLIGEDRKPTIPGAWQGQNSVFVSALTGDNIETLLQTLQSMLVGDRGVGKELDTVPGMRHKIQLEACLVAARRASTALRDALSAELIAADVTDALHSIDVILGRQHPSRLLDQIFKRFCIGK